MTRAHLPPTEAARLDSYARHMRTLLLALFPAEPVATEVRR